jgi:phosphoglycolate phosphatase-like HAD superfamily hydrolase
MVFMFPFSKKKVILFDIDGTLVDVTSIHLEAYRTAFKKVANITITNSNHLTREFGRAETELMRSVLETYNIKKPPNELIEQLITSYTQNVITQSQRITPGKVLPGVRKLLQSLKEDKKILVAISGNPKEIGNALLNRTKIGSFFDTTAFASEKFQNKLTQKRSQIVQLGIERTKQLQKEQKISLSSILIVGDAPSDIKAAKELGIDSLAVATGHYSILELQRYNPAFIIEDFSKIE